MDVQVELEDDEHHVVSENTRAASLVVATAMTGSLRSPTEVAFTVGALVAGVGSISFATAGRQLEFEESLQHGCRSARARLLQLAGLGGGQRALSSSLLAR
jgi:hypothetical protein